MSASPSKPLLSPDQLRTLAELGQERTAGVGDVLFQVGDRRYPFMGILEGEAAILDADGEEITRHGALGFLGEINLLSGQTVYLTAVVTEPMRYIAVEREQLRKLLDDDGPLSETLLSAFVARREVLQSREGVGMQIVGPHASAPTRTTVEFSRRNRLPYTWLDTELPINSHLIDGLTAEELPLVRLPGGPDLRNPSHSQVSRALGVGLELAPREEVDLLVLGAGPAGLGAAVYGASEGLDTLVLEAPRWAGRLAPRAGSRTISASRLGSPARS